MYNTIFFNILLIKKRRIYNTPFVSNLLQQKNGPSTYHQLKESPPQPAGHPFRKAPQRSYFVRYGVVFRGPSAACVEGFVG